MPLSKYCSDDQESRRRKEEQWSHDSPTSKFFLKSRDDDKDGNESKCIYGPGLLLCPSSALVILCNIGIEQLYLGNTIYI